MCFMKIINIKWILWQRLLQRKNFPAGYLFRNPLPDQTHFFQYICVFERICFGFCRKKVSIFNSVFVRLISRLFIRTFISPAINTISPEIIFPASVFSCLRRKCASIFKRSTEKRTALWKKFPEGAVFLFISIPLLSDNSPFTAFLV